MASNSSNAMPFRLLVMFACLIAIPLAAVLGPSFPDVVRTLLAGRNEAKADGVRGRLDDAPRFGKTACRERRDEAWGGRVSWGKEWRQGEAECREAGGSLRECRAQPARATMAAESMASGVTDELGRIQQRLRQLGATYYHLETWGDSGKRFRFCCKVAIGGDGRRVQYFEAVDGSPVEAMEAVLRRVEAWGVDFGRRGL